MASRSLRLYAAEALKPSSSFPNNLNGNHTPRSSLRFRPQRPCKAAQAVLTTNPPPSAAVDRRESRSMREAVTPETLDGWLRDSVDKIVRNIGDAPVLVHIFSGAASASTSFVEVEVERERWPSIRNRWDLEGSMPDGIVLVEELKDKQQLIEKGEENIRGSCRKKWGLVMQGRGMKCPMCYILDTCRVSSSAGFCTHFCLVRATCSGDSAEAQLRKAWLL